MPHSVFFKLKRAKRIENIKTLLLQGFHVKEIAHELGVCSRTILRDLDAWCQTSDFEDWANATFKKILQKKIKKFDNINNTLLGQISRKVIRHLSQLEYNRLKKTLNILATITDPDKLNETERIFYSQAKDKGWLIIRGGEPDFLCVDPNGRIHFVEIKSGNDKLREKQKIYHRVLATIGLDVRVSYDGKWCFE